MYGSLDTPKLFRIGTFVPQDVSRMIFGGGILAGALCYWGNPYLSTVLFCAHLFVCKFVLTHMCYKHNHNTVCVFVCVR